MQKTRRSATSCPFCKINQAASSQTPAAPRRRVTLYPSRASYSLIFFAKAPLGRTRMVWRKRRDEGEGRVGQPVRRRRRLQRNHSAKIFIRWGRRARDVAKIETARRSLRRFTAVFAEFSRLFSTASLTRTAFASVRVADPTRAVTQFLYCETKPYFRAKNNDEAASAAQSVR